MPEDLRLLDPDPWDDEDDELEEIEFVTFENRSLTLREIATGAPSPF